MPCSGKKLRQAQHDGAADGGVNLHLDGVDGADKRGAIEGRLLGHLGAAGEGDEAHVDVPGHFAAGSFGASCAATMRVGLTSFTRMLNDTSIASRIVVLAQGRVTGTTGRARPSSRTDKANMMSAGGTCRRQGRLHALRTMLRLLMRNACLPGRRSSHRYSAGSKGSASINHRFWGHRKLMAGRNATADGSFALVRVIAARAWRTSSTDSGGASRGLPAPRPFGGCAAPRSGRKTCAVAMIAT